MSKTLPLAVVRPVLVLMTFTAGAASADVLSVPGDYATIQGAVNAAVDGDRIVVHPGTYVQRILVEKDVVIESLLGPLVTTIDGNGQGTTVTFRGVSASAALTGFTITGGHGYSSSTLIWPGGGIWVDSGSPRIVRCIISGNDAYRGGGLRLESGSAELRNCLITGNTGQYGPGISSAWDQVGGFNGSAIVGCTITGNSGYVGGGLHIDGGHMTMVNSIVHGNEASHSNPLNDNVSVSQYASLIVDYCGIQGGESGVYVGQTTELFWGAGNVMADRLFVDPAVGDFHLQPASTLIDGGDPAFVPLPGEVDLDGDPRLIGSRVDIGADEVFGDCNGNGVPDPVDTASGTSSDCNANAIPDECEPDCNGNGQADGCDMGLGLSADCNGNGLPDECDIAAGTSTDCDRNGVPDECEPDCNENGVTDACDIASGISSDACNGNGVPDECELDCINASTTVLYTIDGAEQEDHLGVRLGILGDVDGDGRDEVFVSGASGSPVTIHAGVDGSALYTVPWSESSTSVAAAGDVDGDGIPDLLLGMPYAQKVQIHSGLGGSLLQVLTGPFLYGWSVAGGADVDSDGVPDVLVGAPRGSDWNYDPGGDGVAVIHSGADGSVIRTLSCSGGCLFGYAGNPGAGDQFGKDVAMAGDLDLDGHAEVMVAYQAKDCFYVYPGDIACSNQPPGVKVYSGIDGALMFDYPKISTHRSMGGVGDVDADGAPDFAIAGINAYYGIRVFSGQDGSLLLHLKMDADGLSDLTVARAGDVNEDGHADLVVGAPRPFWSLGQGGAVFVRSGLDGRLLGRHVKPDSRFGYTVAGAGNLDGDGQPDFLASDPFFGADSSVGQVTALTLSESTLLPTSVGPGGTNHGR